MEELWRLFLTGLCFAALYWALRQNLLQIKLTLFHWGFRGFARYFWIRVQCCTAALWGRSDLLCSRQSAVCTRRLCSFWCPYRLYDSADYRWCTEEGRVIALGQAVMQSREPFGVTVQLFDSIYYVDVIGLSPSVRCPVANLHCQITGDNSDAIGGQLRFPTSGRGVKQ